MSSVPYPSLRCLVFVFFGLVVAVLYLLAFYSSETQDAAFGFTGESQTLTASQRRTLEKVVILEYDAISKQAGAMKLFELPTEACQKGRKTCRHVAECEVPCELTANRSRLTEAAVILFHPDLNGFLPLAAPHKVRRRVDNAWQKLAVFGHEPVWKRPRRWLNLTWMADMDFSVHWGRNADVRLFFYSLDMVGFSVSSKWWMQRDVLWQSAQDGLYTGLTGRQQSALASVIVSNCHSKERNAWLKAFLEGVPSASFGSCFTNAVVPNSVSSINDRAKQKIRIIYRFPFHLAIESTQNEAGWVTEKLYQALLAGTIPIYYGPPDVFSLAPPHSFIYAPSFLSVHDLTRYVRSVYHNKTLFESYHAWRTLPNIASHFAPLEQELSRKNVACRICKFYRQQMKPLSPATLSSVPSVLQKTSEYSLAYTSQYGWVRLLRQGLQQTEQQVPMNWVSLHHTPSNVSDMLTV